MLLAGVGFVSGVDSAEVRSVRAATTDGESGLVWLPTRIFTLQIPNMLFHCCFPSPLNQAGQSSSKSQAILCSTEELLNKPSFFCFFSPPSGLQCNYRALGEGFQDLLVQLHQVHASCECFDVLCRVLQKFSLNCAVEAAPVITLFPIKLQWEEFIVDLMKRHRG